MNGLMPLTNREIEILELISNGQSTRDIALRLFLSSETIKTHRKNIMLKLDAKNVANLIRKAFEKNIITINSPFETITFNIRKGHELVA